MGTLGRVAGFLLGLAVVFVVALAAGSRWGPTVTTPVGNDDEPGHRAPAGHAATEAERLPGDLVRSQDGYSLDLQPYLGAYGHLVALREGDPEIRFTAEVPSAGRYRSFLDFRHGGTVHTATFDVTAQPR
jgi:hypothetical protein